MNNIREPIIKSENQIFCRIEHPDKFGFLDELETFLRENGHSYEVRIAFHSVESILLNTEELDINSINDLIVFFEKHQENPRIVHFSMGKFMITDGSWDQVKHSMVSIVQEVRKKEFQQIKVWYEKYGLDYIKNEMAEEEPRRWTGIRMDIEQRALAISEQEWLNYVKNNGPW